MRWRRTQITVETDEITTFRWFRRSIEASRDQSSADTVIFTEPVAETNSRQLLESDSPSDERDEKVVDNGKDWNL